MGYWLPSRFCVIWYPPQASNCAPSHASMQYWHPMCHYCLQPKLGLACNNCNNTATAAAFVSKGDHVLFGSESFAPDSIPSFFLLLVNIDEVATLCSTSTKSSSYSSLLNCSCCVNWHAFVFVLPWIPVIVASPNFLFTIIIVRIDSSVICCARRHQINYSKVYIPLRQCNQCIAAFQNRITVWNAAKNLQRGLRFFLICPSPQPKSVSLYRI